MLNAICRVNAPSQISAIRSSGGHDCATHQPSQYFHPLQEVWHNTLMSTGHTHPVPVKEIQAHPRVSFPPYR